MYLIWLTPIDINAYENEPISYVRSIFDVAGGLSVPRNFALDFIETSIGIFPEELDNYLKYFFVWLENSPDPIEKEAILLGL